MTLIEILIVLSLIMLLTGTLLFGSGIFGGANKRAAASLVVAGVRKGLAHANTTGRPVRLAMNFESGRIILEESASSQALRRDAEAIEKEAEKDVGVVMLAEAEAAAEAMLSGKAGSSASFSPVDVLGQDGDTPGREIGSGIRFLKVQTEHDDEPFEDGVAHLYFWPGGVTERAIIQVAKKSDTESALTVVVSPLTGRADIKRGLVELPEELFDDDDEYSERDEP